MMKIEVLVKSKRKMAIIFGILAALILVGVLLTDAFSRQSSSDIGEKETKENMNLKLLVFPKKYVITMSSTPGIRILAKYQGTGDQVKYSANYGQLLTWDSTTGKIKEYGKNISLVFDGLDRPVYWVPPLKDESLNKIDRISVEVSILNNNLKVAGSQAFIKLDDAGFFSVEDAPDVIVTEDILLSPITATIDDAVIKAVKEQGKNYYEGEFGAEGHIILDSEENAGIVTVYCVCSVSWFGFENGIFTGVSGSGAIPTVITFSKNESDGYTLLDYREPLDGAGYSESIKKMFPKNLRNQLVNTDHYPELTRQLEEQAKKYLQSIGRSAQVSLSHVDKNLPEINVEASNKLFAEYTKYDHVLNNFPYWLGTKELLENGERYIYETSQSKTDDGYDMISFKKTKEDGTLVKEYHYKIVGNEPERLASSSSSPK